MPKPSKYTTVYIPTKTYLKKYAHYKLGEYVFADGSHAIQKYLTNLLEKKLYDYDFKALNRQFNDSLPVSVTRSAFEKIGFGIRPENVIDFNNFLEHLFDEDLYTFCQNYLRDYKVAGSAILTFASEYNISLTVRTRRKLTKEPRLEDARNEFARKVGLEIGDDISFECLKKMEYRARKRLENHGNIFSLPVPELSNSQLTLLFQ